MTSLDARALVSEIQRRLVKARQQLSTAYWAIPSTEPECRKAVRLIVEELLPDLTAALGLIEQQQEALAELIAQWRGNVLAIGPHLEGAAFEQCANQVEAVLAGARPVATEGDTNNG